MAPSANPVGASAWLWRASLDNDDALAAVARAAAELGFHALELPLDDAAGWDPARAAALLSEHGLRGSVCTVMDRTRDLGSFDPAVVRCGRDHLRACVDAAAELDPRGLVCGPLHGPSLARRRPLGSTERQIVLERIASALESVAAHAAERGVRLAVEPVNRYESGLVNTAAQCLELVAMVDSPACGVALDTFHMNIEERDPAAAVRRAGSRLMHLHVCGNDRGAPGADHVYWTALAEALREVRYRGALVVESCELGEQPARDSLAFLRSLLVQTPAYA